MNKAIFAVTLRNCKDSTEKVRITESFELAELLCTAFTRHLGRDNSNAEIEEFCQMIDGKSKGDLRKQLETGRYNGFLHICWI